ncbi:MAG: hypothetical protein NTZ42_03330 [Candidatus Gribaldobacteria bacterium]|nr:hypothetical protein [Candidatus Gribaldobacteria bacterium]
MKRLSKVKIEWSAKFSYAVGLMATDGNLSKDGRHMDMTSKDEEMILSFKECFGIKNKIGRKSRGGSKEKRYFRIQFGDKNFYNFLLSIGFTPTKSKTLGRLMIPCEYFADFLRGCIDGDGNIRIAKHPESQYPQLRISLYSASPLFLRWIKDEILKLVCPSGGWIGQDRNIEVLHYAKSDSIKLLNFIYYSRELFCLNRKYIIAEPFLRT